MKEEVDVQTGRSRLHLPLRSGTKMLGAACCGKLRLARCNEVIVGAWPDHPPIIITSDGKIEPLLALLGGLDCD